ncbi:response regulator receiver protein [Spirosoma pollinicola]|uniref:Response regulator receiver protein n=2 Tax=Spirosoma pollinicola TaxID=2057025 RepID=A0A2K8ZBH1_9BACT|nr:response regulator receiver protein [Spirosoma pollinicola]
MITASRVRLPIDELKFLQATGNYSWLYWTNGEKVLTSRTLNYYQPQLPGAWFIRLHRNCIVNLRYVERLERVETNKSGLVYLHSGEVLPVSRRRLCMVKRLIVRYQNSTTN